jgi:hypothetical protein
MLEILGLETEAAPGSGRRVFIVKKLSKKYANEKIDTKLVHSIGQNSRTITNIRP